MATRSSERAASAARDSQRSRAAPPEDGGLARPAGPEEDVAHEVGQGHLAVVGPRRPAHEDDRVADLLAREEPFATPDEVGDAPLGERRLELLALTVGAEEHRDLGRLGARLDECRDARGDVVGLGRVVVGDVQLGDLTVVALGAQLDGAGAPAAARAAEHEVGQPHDLGRGAVVAHQLDDVGPRVPGAEAEQVLGRGPREAVDGLGGVADDAHVVAVPEPEVEQGLLEPVDVLVLVDHEVSVLAAHRPGHLVVLAEDAGGEEEDVLEVDDAPVGLDVLVGGQQPGHRRGVEPAGGSRRARAAAAA